MKGLVLPSPSENGMRFEWIGGVRVYRPREASEASNRSKAEKFLREKFEPGVYTEKSRIQAIFHRQVDFFGSRFDELIPKVACRSFLEFVLWQYDQCGIAESRRRKRELSGEALSRWVDVNHSYPRALKYVAERITMLGPTEDAENRTPSLDEIDELFVCAEQLVSYCITSDLTQLFPEHTKVVIQERGRSTYIDHTVEDRGMSGFQERIYKDSEIRDTLFSGPTYELDFRAHAAFLDQPLLNSIGLTYAESLSILARLKDGCTAIPGDPFQAKFVLIEGVINKVAKMFNKEPAAIEKLLSGFWLTKDKLLARAKPNEDLWKPSNHYRAYRRALFVMPHALGAHMAFSDQMFTESLVIMQGNLSYGAFPKEWLTAEVQAALGNIVTARGHWFEEQVQKNLESIGIVGLSGKVSIGRGSKGISLPGEFDFIGWSRKDDALVLIEAKMMQPASEPGLWKNQCDNFTQVKEGEENFVQKLARKSDWLTRNSKAVSEALITEGIGITNEPARILSGFITYAPNAASYFVSTFPCVALSEFLADYKNSQKWPYSVGIYSAVN